MGPSDIHLVALNIFLNQSHSCPSFLSSEVRLFLFNLDLIQVLCNLVQLKPKFSSVLVQIRSRSSSVLSQFHSSFSLGLGPVLVQFLSRFRPV